MPSGRHFKPSAVSAELVTPFSRFSGIECRRTHPGFATEVRLAPRLARIQCGSAAGNASRSRWAGIRMCAENPVSIDPDESSVSLVPTGGRVAGRLDGAADDRNVGDLEILRPGSPPSRRPPARRRRSRIRLATSVSWICRPLPRPMGEIVRGVRWRCFIRNLLLRRHCGERAQVVRLTT